MTLQTSTTNRHAGGICSRCNGNIMLKGDEVACIQCGYIQYYIDQPTPLSGQPYAAPHQQHHRPHRSKHATLGTPLTVLTEAQAKTAFNTDQRAIQWLRNVRWPNGPACHYCNEPGAEPHDDDENENGPDPAAIEYYCPQCPRRYTLFSETPLLGSNIHPAAWLLGAWHLKARPELQEKPAALGRKLGISERAAKTVIQTFQQAAAENRELYETTREARRRPPARIECNNMNDTTTTTAAAPPAPCENDGFDDRPTGTPAPEAPQQEEPAPPPEPEPEAPERDLEPTATTPETEPKPQTATLERDPEPPTETPETEPEQLATTPEREPEPEPPFPEPSWPPHDATDWTMQECRADLVRKRDQLARRKQKLEAEIRDNEERISKLDEVARYIQEWKESRK